MSRLDAFLLLALIACALSVVNSTYQQRRVFVELERAQGQQQSLGQDWTRLQYEQSALSKTSRIEDISSNQLGMSAVTAGRTEYLNEDGSAVSIAPLPASVSAVAPPPRSSTAPPTSRPVQQATVAKPPVQSAVKKQVPTAALKSAASSRPARATHDERAAQEARAARAARDDRAAAAAAAAIMSGKAGANGGGRQ